MVVIDVYGCTAPLRNPRRPVALPVRHTHARHELDGSDRRTSDEGRYAILITAVTAEAQPGRAQVSASQCPREPPYASLRRD